MGTGAERQLRIYRETQDLKAVMDYVVAETEHGLDLGGVQPAQRGAPVARL
jgi:hypothetical protein